MSVSLAEGGGSSQPIVPWTDPEADLVEWWDVGTDLTLTNNLASDWLGRGPGYHLTSAGSLRPTYGASVITDERAKTYAGLVFAGSHGMQCSDAAFKTRMHALQVAHVIVGGVSNTQAGTQTMCELGIAWFNTAGQFGIFINDTVSFSVEAGIRGSGAGLGVWRSDAGAFPWADPGVLHFKLGGATVGSTAQELDGVAMLGGVNSNSYAAGNFASANLYVAYRGDSSVFGYFTLSQFGILGPNATVGAVRRAHAYAGARIGAVQG